MSGGQHWLGKFWGAVLWGSCGCGRGGRCWPGTQSGPGHAVVFGDGSELGPSAGAHPLPGVPSFHALGSVPGPWLAAMGPLLGTVLLPQGWGPSWACNAPSGPVPVEKESRALTCVGRPRGPRDGGLLGSPGAVGAGGGLGQRRPRQATGTAVSFFWVDGRTIKASGFPWPLLSGGVTG